MTSPLRICELFAGIGATAQGLRDLGIPFESRYARSTPGRTGRTAPSTATRRTSGT